MIKLHITRLQMLQQFITFLLFSFLALPANAQMIVPPMLQDTLVYSPAYNPNCAVIDYSPNCFSCGRAQLKAVCYNNGFTVDDGVNTPINTSVTFGSGAFPSADIILGNSKLSSTDYKIGFAYNSNDSIFLSLYTVVQPGTGSFNVVFDSTIFIDSGNAPGPNIDVIAEYNHPYLGLPLCDQFVMVYQNFKGLHAYHARLNSPTIKDTITFADTAHYTALYPPDVAAIQRLDFTHFPPIVDTLNIALFTFRGDNGTPLKRQLYYREWKIGSALSAAVAIDSNIYKLPKIAAIDDYRINNGSLANYLITSSQYSSGPGNTGVIKVYSNLSSYGGSDISSLAFSNLKSELVPAVALGPGLQYTVGYPNDSFMFNTYFAQNIDISTGNVFPTNKYYIVPTSIIASNPFIIALSGTCNTNNYLLSCWENYNGTSLEVDGKLSDSSMIFFKQTSVNTVQNNTTWSVSPNPATDHISLITTAYNGKCRYAITDITGRTVLQNNITQTLMKINVSDLRPGTYMINIINLNGTVKQTLKFIKE